MLVNPDLERKRQINPWGSLANQPGLSDAIQAKRDLFSSKRWTVPEKCCLKLPSKVGLWPNEWEIITMVFLVRKATCWRT